MEYLLAAIFSCELREAIEVFMMVKFDLKIYHWLSLKALFYKKFYGTFSRVQLMKYK